VYLGAFRRLDLLDAGGWDEELVSNQDFDLNRRMAVRGLVWFDASLRSGYVPRESLRLLWRQYRRFGRAKVHYWRQVGALPEPRQWVLLVAPPVLVVGGVVAAANGGAAVRAGLVVAGLAGASYIEMAGSRTPRAGLAGHACGVAAMVVVAFGWWWGAVSSLVRRLSRGGRG
jgi:hypothetical protein